VKSLQVQYTKERDEEDPLHDTITCPAEALSIHVNENDVLDTLTMPALSSLKIFAETWNFARNLETAVFGLLQRSSCSLSTLELLRVGLEPELLINLLQLIPTLRSLNVDDSGLVCDYTPSSPISDHFLQLLQIQLSQSPPSFVLPRLETLILTVAGTTFTDSAFTDMVKSRCLHSDLDVIAHLTTVQLLTRRKTLTPECVEELRSISEGGVRMHISDNTGRVL
jgi:hypothetical protein